MKPSLWLTGAMLASFSPASHSFAIEMNCSVGISEVTGANVHTTTIQSSGLIQALNSSGEVSFFSTVSAFHQVVKQSNGTPVGDDSGKAPGEVHTHVRAEVDKGFIYDATLWGNTGFLGASASCMDRLIIENPDPPGDDSTLDPSDGPQQQDCSPWCGSPIVIDLDRRGFRFTSVEDGVRFDLTPGGDLEQIAWTAAGGEDAFLVLDRDGDGMISDGSELFGDATPQPLSNDPNGYRALAVFDMPTEGGNGDGQITAADSVYHELLLWIDRNHDGVSQPEELATLASSGILAIDLNYVESRRRDRHGNEMRYMSLVRLMEGTTQAVDVFFAQE